MLMMKANGYPEGSDEQEYIDGGHYGKQIPNNKENNGAFG